MSQFDVECVVIGAGVVGLACAARLAEQGREVLVIERNNGIGEEISARNSEVIHAGIYYQPGSLKARLCVEGKSLLYRYCAERQIRYERIGKLIVACDDEEIHTLRQLQATAIANGVHDLRWLTGEEAREIEPAIRCKAALFSPSTGIVDSHGLMLSLQADLEDRGGAVSFGSVVTKIRMTGDGVEIHADCGGESVAVKAAMLVNCAGLGARQVAGLCPGNIILPNAWFAKGSYFRLSGPAPFRHLIYPVPVPGGLGVHLTLDLDHRARFGPDVERVAAAAATLNVEPQRGQSFYQSIRRYWPELPDDALQPDYAGIRPKITHPGATEHEFSDFAILTAGDHGMPGVVHCLGIESPGLTSSLAIALMVATDLRMTRAP